MTALKSKLTFLFAGLTASALCSQYFLTTCLTYILLQRFPEVTTTVSDNYGSDFFWRFSLFVVSFVLLVIFKYLHDRYAVSGNVKDDTYYIWLRYIAIGASILVTASILVYPIDYFFDSGMTLSALSSIILCLLFSALFNTIIFQKIEWMQKNKHISSLLLVVAFLVGGGMLLIGFHYFGLPWNRYDSTLDSKRAGDIQTIKSDIQDYLNYNNALPTDLASLKETDGEYTADTSVDISDPKTKKSYEYSIADDAYSICAQFSMNYKESYALTQDTTLEDVKPTKGHFCITTPYQISTSTDSLDNSNDGGTDRSNNSGIY